MSLRTFEDYLSRMEVEFEVDEENEAIDIFAETGAGDEYTISLVIAGSAYTLFVSPLVDLGDSYDPGKLYRRLLEIAEENRHVKLTIDADGDVKLSAEGFARLDAFGQFRRRLQALQRVVDAHRSEIAVLGGA